MIVAAFLNWATTARSADRAKAASALARAYLQDQLDYEQRDAALIAMAHLVSDPSVKVRRSLAEALAHAQDVPRHIMLALANDQPDVAADILLYSPSLTDDDLIEIAASSCSASQALLVLRPSISKALIAAFCEIVDEAAALVLLGRHDITFSSTNLTRLTTRFSANPNVRGDLLARDDLPLEARQVLLGAITQDLRSDNFLAVCLGEKQLSHIVQDAERFAQFHLVEDAQGTELKPLLGALITGDKLSVDMLICLAALGLNEAIVEAIVQLSHSEPVKIRKLLVSGRSSSVNALFGSIGLDLVASNLLCDITLYWRGQTGFEGLSGLLVHLRKLPCSADERHQRSAYLSIIDRLQRLRRFDGIQDDIRQIQLCAA